MQVILLLSFLVVLTPPPCVFLTPSPHWLPILAALGLWSGGGGHRRPIDLMEETADTLSAVSSLLSSLISSTKASN